MFKLVVCDQWIRIKPQGDEVTVFTEPRPHIVPTSDTAEKIVIVDAARWLGSTGLCPGKALVDGKWVFAYRFQEITAEVAQEIIAELTRQVEAIIHAAHD